MSRQARRRNLHEAIRQRTNGSKWGCVSWTMPRMLGIPGVVRGKSSLPSEGNSHATPGEPYISTDEEPLSKRYTRLHCLTEIKNKSPLCLELWRAQAPTPRLGRGAWGLCRRRGHGWQGQHQAPLVNSHSSQFSSRTRKPSIIQQMKQVR